jgi:EmrB/QacA subfamily drug resistance transporter
MRRIRTHSAAPLAVVLAGVFVIVLDFFIVNVMLPSMQSALHASSGEIEWVIASYGITFAAFLITAGRLGDRYGRRRVLLLGMALFTMSSLICGVAPDVTTLIAARALQGVGAALISPNILSIIGVTYTGEARVRALRTYGLVMGLAAVGGQVIGGILLQADPLGLGWRSCFLINIPVGIAALALAPALVSESRAMDADRPDLVGMVLVSLGLIAIVLPLIEGRQLGWPAWSWVLLASAPAWLGTFALHERLVVRRGGAPLLDPGLFRARAFSSGLLTQCAFWCQQAASYLALALYLQEGRGLSPLDSGLVFTILAAAYLAVSLRAPALTVRFGRDLIALGAGLLVAGYGLMAVAALDSGAHASVLIFAPGLLLVGAGQGLCITPLTVTVMSALDPARAGSASGLLSTMQQVGNSIGVAVTGVILFGLLDSGFDRAFAASAGEFAALAALVIALTRLMPRPPHTRDAGSVRWWASLGTRRSRIERRSLQAGGTGSR